MASKHPATHTKGTMPHGGQMVGHAAAFGAKQMDASPKGGHVGSPELGLKSGLRRGGANGSNLKRGKGK